MDIPDWTSWQNNSRRTAQWVASLHSFTIYLHRWIIPVHTTNMGKPFPDFTTEFVMHSTLVCCSPQLLLSLWHARQWMGCSIIVPTGTPLDLQNEGLKLTIALRVHPPAMNVHRLLHISTDYYVLLHIITYYYILLFSYLSRILWILWPSLSQIFLPYDAFGEAPLSRKYLLKIVLGLLKNLQVGAHHNILRIC